jgi:hypothetical protein
MATVITSDSGSISPVTVSEFFSRSESGTIVHRILGSSSADITFSPAQLRTGNFTLRFHDELSAASAVEFLKIPQVCALAVPERPSIDGMTFVVIGEINQPWYDAGAWAFTIGYHEVAE